MNDLDKRIAEMKGWHQFSRAGDGAKYWGTHQPAPYGGVEIVARYEDAAWSTSDSKALELVDELTAGEDGIYFTLEGSGHHWTASFKGPDNYTQENASTRAEAICRVYCTAREWMATKAGA